jgi:hypothetical protein
MVIYSAHVLVLTIHHIKYDRCAVTKPLNIVISYDQPGHLPVEVDDAAVLFPMLQGKYGAKGIIEGLELLKELFVFGVGAE